MSKEKEMGNGDISPARRKGSLPPEVERILQAIGFVDRFSRLPTNLAPQDRMEIKTCREPARGALRELGIPAKYSPGVGFHLEEDCGAIRVAWGFYPRKNLLEFRMSVRRKGGALLLAAPWHAWADELLPHNGIPMPEVYSYRDLVETLREAYALYQDIRDGIWEIWGEMPT